jgi:hypothetical protein
MRRNPGTTGHASPYPIVMRMGSRRRKFIGELLGSDPGQLDAHLLHRRDDLGMDANSRFRAGGNRAHLVVIGEPVEPCGSHLRPPGVVDACKEYGLHVTMPSTKIRRTRSDRASSTQGILRYFVIGQSIHDPVGDGGQRRHEPSERRRCRRCAKELGDDETRNVHGSDAREGVACSSSECDRGVGEGRG